MDFLAKKREYVFLNNRNATVRVHVKQVSSTPYSIWVGGKTKKYRDTVMMLKKVLKEFPVEKVPAIVIVDNQKLGEGSISSYYPVEDVIFFNSKYDSTKKIDDVVKQDLFIANDLYQVIQHELGHKQHWDAVKRFYGAHKSRYNNIMEAKNALDSKLEKYITIQLNNNFSYLLENVSAYADVSFKFAKDNYKYNLVNEVIAEVVTQKNTKDPKLTQLVKEELNYGNRN